jgi:primosomal protein N' (replication factor Y) (superfamily II helicase)
MKSIASVVLSSSTREFDRIYDYLVPTELMDRIIPGGRVIVPFGKSNKSVEAYVLELADSSETRELKEIKEAVDAVPVLKTDLIKLAIWMKHRYLCTYGDAAKCMLPPGIGVKSYRLLKLENPKAEAKGSEARILEALVEMGKECEYDELKNQLNIKDFSKKVQALLEAGIISVYEGYSTGVREKTVRVACLARAREEIMDELESNRIRKIQHVRILEMLLDNEYIGVSDLVRFASVSPGVLDTLKKYGYIDFREVEVNRDPYRMRDIPATSPLLPTREQASVLEACKQNLQGERFAEMLLHGVTGSGKTEVYLQLIQFCFDQGRQAVVLVPEISLTPQMVERFKGRFGNDVAVLHSRLSLGERYDQWRMIREGKIKVVVGARSAVFAPFDKLGLVIIDEEHENTYKSETTPKYHARDVAAERCRNTNALLLYGSATPSVETCFRARKGEIGLLEMKERANNMLMPAVEIVDMRSELNEGNRSIFSNKLAEEIGKNIEAGEQTILFLNRRGHSSFVLCRSCGYVLKCTGCSINMTYHANDERLICHYCGFTVRNPKLCPKCKSNYIRHFGTGTQRVEEDIKKQFPGGSVIRMDMDTTSYKNAHEEILKAFREQNINIMVGTQMIAKGHDFPRVTLVGVLAADSLLNTGDYRAGERTFQLVTQVAGRAGRGELPGRVVIQTYNTEDFSITSASRHDYDAFYSQEILIREKLDYPPFTNIGVLILSGGNDSSVCKKAKEVRNSIADSFETIDASADILGPARSPLYRMKNKYRWRIVIKCKNLNMLLKVLETVSHRYNGKKDRGEVDISMDINPVNMT